MARILRTPPHEMPRLSTGQIELRVRYVESDPMGFLHHSQYFVYFEMGRTELLRRSGVPYAEMEQRGLFYVIVRVECHFRAPARYDDVLTLTTSLVRLTRSRADHVYELRLRDGGRLLAEGNSTLGLVDRTGRVCALPDELFELLRSRLTVPPTTPSATAEQR